MVGDDLGFVHGNPLPFARQPSPRPSQAQMHVLREKRNSSLVGELNRLPQLHRSILPFDQIKLRRLIFEGNRLFPTHFTDCLVLFPGHLLPLLRWWLQPALLAVPVPWNIPDPQVFVESDASDLR